VLILVLSMVMLMSVLLLGFNHNARGTIDAAYKFKNRKQALNCARTALNIAIAAVRDNNDICSNKELRDLFSGQNRFDIDGADCSITIVEENSKINLNLLTTRNGRLNRAAIEQLLCLIDVLNKHATDTAPIRYGIVPSIIDWIDADDKVVSLPFIKNDNLGAESGYYRNRKEPYACRNAPLDTVADIVRVKGMTAGTFERIANYVTVYGDGRISINSASSQTIQSLSRQIDPAVAAVIVNHRKFKPFESIDEIKTLPAVTDDIYQAIRAKAVITSENQYYRINSKANLDEITAEITTVLQRNTDKKTIDVILYQEL